MAVFSDRMISDLAEATITSFRAYGQKLSLVLTYEEAIGAFIEHEHIEKLKEVTEMVGTPGVHAFLTKVLTSGQVPLGNCAVHFVAGAPILIPDYTMLGLAKSCPDELRARITKWADDRYALGAAGGDLVDSLHYLNGKCGDVRAMKTLLPCLPGIMARISSDNESKTAKKARAMLNTTGCGAIPPLSRDIKQRMLEVSALANAIFMSEGPVNDKDSVPGKRAVLSRQDYSYTNVPRKWMFDDGSKTAVTGTFI